MITLTVPIDSKLHAHAKGHWRSKAAATKSLRQLAFMLVAEQTKVVGPCILDIQFSYPDKRRRDLLNSCQSLKPAIDGVVDAGKIEGDHWGVLSIGKITVELGARLQAKLTFRSAHAVGEECPHCKTHQSLCKCSNRS